MLVYQRVRWGGRHCALPTNPPPTSLSSRLPLVTASYIPDNKNNFQRPTFAATTITTTIMARKTSTNPTFAAAMRSVYQVHCSGCNSYNECTGGEATINNDDINNTRLSIAINSINDRLTQNSPLPPWCRDFPDF